MKESSNDGEPKSLRNGRPSRPGEMPPELKEAIGSFIGLKTEEEVLRAFHDSGVTMVGRPPSGPMSPAELDAFKNSWGFTSDDEATEAVALSGLVTVGVGDLVGAARSARHPLTVAKAIVGASRGLEDGLRQVVPVLRERGYSWTQIGSAIGMSKQSAWERFSGED